MIKKLTRAVQCACLAAWTRIVPQRSASKKCIPDFSDIAHLTISFDGICLPDEQMTLVKVCISRFPEWDKHFPVFVKQHEDTMT